VGTSEVFTIVRGLKDIEVDYSGMGNMWGETSFVNISFSRTHRSHWQTLTKRVMNRDLKYYYYYYYYYYSLLFQFIYVFSGFRAFALVLLLYCFCLPYFFVLFV
jgi:hypothetical protein